jgi:hypothetical protein
MRKRNLQKAVVLLICFAFLGLSASGLWAADQKQTHSTFRVILKAPVQFLVNLFPWLRGLLNPDDQGQVQPPATSSVNTIRPTADITILRPSGKD